MTSYAFRAIGPERAIESGRIEAESEASARARLSDRGLIPVEIALVRERKLRAGWRSGPGPSDLALGLESLATLLEAGLPLDQAMGALEALAPPSWTQLIPSLRASVRGGKPLATALSEASVPVPPAPLGIIRAGEAGSGLVNAVRGAADLLDSQAELRSSVRSALAYPLVLAFAGFLAVIVLVGIVLPRFALILEDLGQDLPATTTWVLGSAQVARRGGLPALAGLAACGLLWRRWVSTPSGRLAWHRTLLRLPGVRSLRLSRASAQTCAALGALLRAGAPLPSSLRHAAEASGDAEVESRLETVRERVTRGDRLAAALEELGALTPAAVRLVAAGERSGRLADMVERAGELEARETERAIKRFVRMIEPTLILTFGAIVALVAAALLQAVYAVRPIP